MMPATGSRSFHRHRALLVPGTTDTLSALAIEELRFEVTDVMGGGVALESSG
jgi:2-methylisocitrate lyase-like PEP mutase family enzyme